MQAQLSIPPQEVSTIHVAHFADGEVEAQGGHSSAWQDQESEVAHCRALVFILHLTGCGGVGPGWPCTWVAGSAHFGEGNLALDRSSGKNNC